MSSISNTLTSQSSVVLHAAQHNRRVTNTCDILFNGSRVMRNAGELKLNLQLEIYCNVATGCYYIFAKLTSPAASCRLQIAYNCWYWVMLKSAFLDNTLTDFENADKFGKGHSGGARASLYLLQIITDFCFLTSTMDPRVRRIWFTPSRWSTDVTINHIYNTIQ